MRCFNTTLASDIGTGCPSVAGMEANGAIALRSAVRGLSISSTGVATFTIAGDVREVFVPGDMPYKPAVEGTMNDRGLQKFNKTVTFFFPENSYLTQQQIVELQNDGYILMLKDNNGQIMVFGLEAGLRFQSSAQDFNSLDTHGGVDVVMAENNANYPMVFTTYALPFTHEYITGLTIGATGTVFMTAQNPLSLPSYAVFPDGSIQTSTAGTLDYDYTGVAGNLVLIVPKNVSSSYNLTVDDSTFAGTLIVKSPYGTIQGENMTLLEHVIADNANEISFPWSLELLSVKSENAILITVTDCTNLNSIDAPNAWGVQADGCDLSASAIAVILANAMLKTGTAPFKIINVSGGTNDDYNAWSAQAKSDAADLISAGWTVTYNDEF